MLAIFKREFNAYFISPIGYVFLFVFSLSSALFFYIFSLSTGIADLTGVFSLMFWIMMVFIPILTMRLFADDRRQKTDQLTLTSPITLSGLVMGKFLAAMAIFLIGVAFIVVYGVVLSFFSNISWIMIWGNVVGMTLMGMLFISVGILMSAVTENQMVAAISAFMINLVLLIFDLLASALPMGFIRNAVLSLSILSRYNQTTNGIFDLRSVLFFISFTLVFLFLTVRILERRRWN